MKNIYFSLIAFGILNLSAQAIGRPMMQDPGDGDGGGGGIARTVYNAAYYKAMIPPTIGKIKERCENDSLSPVEAKGRFDWLVKNHKGLLVAYYNETLEDDGSSDNDKVSSLESEWFYIGGNRSKPKPRPNYLTFGNTAYENPANWFAPSVASAAFLDFPSGYIALGECTSSCYTPDQKILFSQGEVAIKDALDTLADDVFTLNDGATRESFGFETRKIHHYTRSATETQHKILTITTEQGGQLKVTLNHPLLRADGTMVEAADLKVGDKLIKVDGQDDQIESIAESDFFGRVYNLQPDSTSNEGQIVIAQGFLSGSSWFQNDGLDTLNRVVLRRSIPATVFE